MPGGLYRMQWEARRRGRPAIGIYIRMEGGLCRRPCTHIREARQSGRPGDNFTTVYLEAGLCRRPYYMHMRSPTLREARYKYMHIRGSRSMSEALFGV